MTRRDDVPPPRGQAAPRAFIKSFGCQMNVYDAIRMTDSLAAEGYVEARSPEEADVIVLNTCHIRERAVEKVYSELGRLAVLKKQRAASGGQMLVAVAGCVAQAESAEIVRRQPTVDLVVGPQSYHRLPQLLQRAAEAPGVVDTSFPDEDKLEIIPPASSRATRARGVTSFVTIQEGCDKFCSFCVVPYTRGVEASRKPESILEEIRRLAHDGVLEVSLLGQNVNGYRGEDRKGDVWGLARLMEAIAKIPGIIRIRYTTSHPNDMSEDLIQAHISAPAVMPFLHLPVQSGSDPILRAMNRRHTADEYIRLVERIRAARPDLALSSDFIVGFPGESERDFEETLALTRTVRFANAFSFKYSPRPGTPAAEAPNQTPEAVKRERLARLQVILDEQRREFNCATIGAYRDILFEKPGRRPGQIAGKTPHMQAVHVEGPEGLIGAVRSVQILAAGTNSLLGRLPALDGPTA